MFETVPTNEYFTHPNIHFCSGSTTKLKIEHVFCRTPRTQECNFAFESHRWEGNRLCLPMS